jgi:pilus assembly protein CpaD
MKSRLNPGVEPTHVRVTMCARAWCCKQEPQGLPSRSWGGETPRRIVFIRQFALLDFFTHWFTGMTSRLLRASHISRSLLAFALSILCALALSACGEMRLIEQERDAAAVDLSNAEVRHPIGFTPKRESLDVEVPAGAEGLSPNQQVDVFRFLHRYKREAAGRLVITVPTGVRDKAAIAQSVQEIQRLVAEAGVDYRLRHGAQRDAPAGATPAIRLAYQRPVAVPPPCDDWTRDVGRNEERIPYPNWGCATQRNLALTVDNARDLGQPQGEDPRSSERRSVTWSAYVGGGKAPSDRK